MGSTSLQSRSSKLRELLAGFIKPARDKILAHNDLETILHGSELGGFSEDADEQYWELLQEFLNIVYKKSVGTPAPELRSRDAIWADADAFLDSMYNGFCERQLQ